MSHIGCLNHKRSAITDPVAIATIVVSLSPLSLLNEYVTIEPICVHCHYAQDNGWTLKFSLTRKLTIEIWSY